MTIINIILLVLDVKYGWPIYNVFDEVEKFDGVISAGFYYVKTSNFFPFRGNGWFDADLVDYGVESGIISKDDIYLQYKSSNTLEPKHFEKFVLSVFDKFCSYCTEYSIFNVDIKKAIISFDEDGTICFKTKIDVSKQALNALFGLLVMTILILIILLLSVNML